jgi:putative restriction endonuclease
MKCCNLASLDETHQARGVKGLKKASSVDRDLWAEFQANPDKVGYEAAIAYARIESAAFLPTRQPDLEALEGRERERMVRVRVNQYFFRDMMLAGYSETCAVCRLPIRRLLVASHIVPWSVDPSLRMNPRNGLCLCGTHDLAFEHGFVRVHRDFSIHITLPEGFRPDPATRDWLLRFDGGRIQLPQRWQPDPEFLARKLTLLERDST